MTAVRVAARSTLPRAQPLLAAISRRHHASCPSRALQPLGPSSLSQGQDQGINGADAPAIGDAPEQAPVIALEQAPADEPARPAHAACAPPCVVRPLPATRRAIKPALKP